MKNLISTNPATGETVGKTPVSTARDVTDAVAKAKKAFPSWRDIGVEKRVYFVKRFMDVLADHKEELAKLTTLEMGKPIVQAREDVDWELGFIDWYVRNAKLALSDVIIKEDEKAVYKVTYEPWGVCASIAPWNFPVSMASSGIIQQILAGNTVVFKPTELATMTQKRFVELLWETGIPKGVVELVIGDGEVGKLLIDSKIDLVWFTGSTAVGQEIYAKCGKKFIKGIMELGGSSPAIVFADCDLERTLDTLYSARFFNCGQVCSAVKRLLVEKPVFRTVVEGLKKRVAAKTVGNPFQNVDLGPLVSREQLATLTAQVEDAVKKGATVEIGGRRLAEGEFARGNYFAPTILTNIKGNMKVLTEEVFGPVLPVIPFASEDEAVALANNTPYGLTAEIFTSDEKRGDRIARQLMAGVVGVNTDSFYEPFCPIGGYKKSGMGREYGIEGFRELAQLKYICVAKNKKHTVLSNVRKHLKRIGGNIVLVNL